MLKKLLRKVLLPNAPDERMFLEQHLSAFAKNKSNKLILDVGAGECQYAYLFTEKNKYETCDLENGFHPGIKHDIISTCYDIPRKNSYYDIVLMLQVLEHLEFPVDALKEINRILKDDGLLFLSVPQAAGDHFEPHHYFNYTQYGLNSVLKQAGFDVIKLDRLEGIFVYVGNRIQKLGTIIHSQNLDKNSLKKWGSLLFMSICFWIGFLLSKLNFFDEKKHYCIGIIAIAQKTGGSGRVS